MRILLTGGGTLGSVSPLLAVAKKLEQTQKDVDFLWLGTKKGPEKNIIKKAKLPFKDIYSGKLRRYFSLNNFIDPVFIFLGFFQACFIILKFKPDVVLSAGGFVSVPVVWAAKILNKKSIIHQQDVRPGLANKLMAPFASKITVTLKKSLNDYDKEKSVWVGNPVRSDVLEGSKEKAIKLFNLDKNLPVVFITGGGTGAEAINNLVEQAASELVNFCQIIHLVGKGKCSKANEEYENMNRYHQYEFFTDEMKHAYAVADIIVSRCGMGALTELAHLKKPSILLPIPRTHQEDNAFLFKEKNAAIVLDQEKLDENVFAKEIKKLIKDKEKRKKLSKNIEEVIKKNAVEEFIEIINKIVIK